MQSPPQYQCILVVEDDPDQMELLCSFVTEEIQKIKNNAKTNEVSPAHSFDVRVLKVSNILSLKKAAEVYKNILLAIVDCNIPDAKDSAPHDQLIKTNYRITGQHTSVEILKEHVPNTPITMTSSLDRFQKIVSQYYLDTHDLEINFIRKHDQLMLQRNIAYYLRMHLRALES